MFVEIPLFQWRQSGKMLTLCIMENIHFNVFRFYRISKNLMWKREIKVFLSKNNVSTEINIAMLHNLAIAFWENLSIVVILERILNQCSTCITQILKIKIVVDIIVVFGDKCRFFLPVNAIIPKYKWQLQQTCWIVS